MIELTSIVYKPEAAGADPTDRYLRVPLVSARLVVGHGIEGDRKGGSLNRQLNLMSFETLQALGEAGFNAQPGALGEQLMVRGLEVEQLAVGDRLQIGDQACVEVVSHRNGCQHFEDIQGKPRQLAAGRLGVMAKVVVGGTIQVGDRVTRSAA